MKEDLNVVFLNVYSSNIARDGAGSNNLIYIPKDASEITFVDQTVKNTAGTSIVWTAAAQSEAFFKYVGQDKYLRNRKGQYAERNGVLMPFFIFLFYKDERKRN